MNLHNIINTTKKKQARKRRKKLTAKKQNITSIRAHQER